MRLSAGMLLLSLAGIIGGAALIGVWCIGVALIFDSLALGAFALLRDDATPAPTVRELPRRVDQVFERARHAA